MQIGGFTFKSGQLVNLTWNDGTTCTGVLHITSTGRIFFCHDNYRKEGRESPEMYDYLYSWVFRYLGEGAGFTEDVVSIQPSIKGIETHDIYIDDSLVNALSFLSNQEKHLIYSILSVKTKPIEKYDEISLSEKPGFVCLKGNFEGINGIKRKVVEIKLSRLIRQISNELTKLEEDAAEFYNLPDTFIERINNTLVSFQSGKLIKMEILTGESFVEAYRTRNYASGNCSLHKSCMNDKMHLLEIYVANPNHVSVATFKVDDKVVGRSIIWTIDDKKYFDRIYYSQDWIQSYIKKTLRDLGYEYVNDIMPLSIKLDFVPNDNYPYLDSFHLLNFETGVLYAGEIDSVPPGFFYRSLNRTNGGYESVLA